MFDYEAFFGDRIDALQDEITRRMRTPARPYPLPRGARIVIFHGPLDPWSPGAHRVAPWIKEHYL